MELGINNHIVGLVHQHHTVHMRKNIEQARPTNLSDVSRSLQS